MSRAASIAGFEDPLGDDNDCGICLENELDVAVGGCKHKLCIDCAIRYSPAAPLCSSMRASSLPPFWFTSSCGQVCQPF